VDFHLALLRPALRKNKVKIMNTNTPFLHVLHWQIESQGNRDHLTFQSLEIRFGDEHSPTSMHI